VGAEKRFGKTTRRMRRLDYLRCVVDNLDFRLALATSLFILGNVLVLLIV